MKIKKAIITAGGVGSRFLPLTKAIPKAMIPIVDKPIIHYLVEECAEAEVEEIIIIIKKEEISVFEQYFNDKAENIKQIVLAQQKLDRWAKVEKVFELPKITFIEEDLDLPYGNGRPILSAKALVKNEDAFIVCWGDDLVLSKTSAVKQVKDFYEQSPSDGVLGMCKVPRELLSKGAVIKSDGSNRVTTIKEKLSLKEIEEDGEFLDLYSIGRYVFTPQVFENLDPSKVKQGKELMIQDALSPIIDSGDIRYLELEGKFYTTGDPENYLKAQNAYWKDLNRGS